MTEVHLADMKEWLLTTRDDAACCAKDVKEAVADQEGTGKTRYAKIADQLEKLAGMADGLATTIDEGEE